MRFKQYLKESFITDQGEIETLMKTIGYSVDDGSGFDDVFSINDDNSISTSDNCLLKANFVEDGNLKVKFHSISGNFCCISKNKLTTLEGMPKNIGRSCDISFNKLTTLEFIPRIIKNSLDVSHNPITSLIGVADLFDEVYKISASFSKIKEGGLGLILIPNLKIIREGSQGAFVTGPFHIIAKYLGKGEDGLIECQSELIEAGYEDYAVL